MAEAAAGVSERKGVTADSNGFDWGWWLKRIVPQLLAGYQRFTGHNQFVAEVGAKFPIAHYVMRESRWKLYAPTRFQFAQGSKSVDIPGLDATSKRRDLGVSLGIEARREIGKSGLAFTLGAGLLVAKISSPCDPRFSQAEQDEIDAAGEGIRGFEADGAVLPRDGYALGPYASAGLDYRLSQSIVVGVEGRLNPQMNGVGGQSAGDPSISDGSLLNGALLAKFEWHFDETSGKKAPPDSDTDRDGVPNGKDTCPAVPEDVDSFQDADGCPDHDNDKDGILDAADKCPNDAKDGCAGAAVTTVQPSKPHEDIAMKDIAFEK